MENIKIPSKNEIKKAENYRLQNNFIYQKLYAHENILKNILIEQSIDGDGNCFFSNLSYLYTNNQEIIYFLEIFPQIEVKDKIIDTTNYISKVTIEKNYSGFFEKVKL